MLKRSIQVYFSTNCIAAVPSSKPLYSGTVTARLTNAPNRATQRTACAWLSRPKASSATPKNTGVQIARLSKPIFLFS